MSSARSPEDIRKEMEIVNNSAERKIANAIHVARTDEAKRPVSNSSSLALEIKQRNEDTQNESAIAAVIARDFEQEENNPDWKESSFSTTLIKSAPVVVLTIPNWWETFHDVPLWDDLPNALLCLCLAYADYRLSEEKNLPEEKFIYKYPRVNTAPFFTRYLSQIQYHLEQAANDLLCQGNLDKALALIKANPEVINIETQGKDRFGTRIIGRTLLQMAAMGDDVNLREKKEEEKEDHGAVELFAQAAGLSKDDIAIQLFPVLFSEEAKKANAARINAVLAILKEFGESLIRKKGKLPKKWKTNDEFKAAQAICKDEIDKLRNDLLKIVSHQTILFSYILDAQVLVECCQWFEHRDNFKRFVDWDSVISDIFWVNSYGSLQFVAAARDAHIHREGIGSVVDDGKIPARTLKNPDGSSYFSSDSRLGRDFFLGYCGLGAMGVPRDSGLLAWLENLCRAKKSALLCYATRPLSETTLSLHNNVGCGCRT